MKFKEPFVGLVCERLCIKKNQNIWCVAAVDKELNLYKIANLRSYRSAKAYFNDYNEDIKINKVIGFIKPGTLYKFQSRYGDRAIQYEYNYQNPGWIFAKEILN